MNNDRLDFSPPPPPPPISGPLADSLQMRLKPLSVTEELLLPFRMLGEHHIFLLLYILVLSGSAVYIGGEINELLLSEIEVLTNQLKLNPGFVQILSTSAALLSWFLIIPVLLVAATLPIEVIWMHGTLRLKPLVTLTPKSIVAAFQTIVLGIYSAFYLLIPLFALGGLYIVYFERLARRSAPAVLYLIGLSITIGVLGSIIPIFFAPMIAICGQSGPHYALSVAKPITYRSAIRLAMALVVILFGAALSIYVLSFRELDPSRQMLVWGGLFVFFSWYYLTIAAQIIMNETSRFLKGM